MAQMVHVHINKLHVKVHVAGEVCYLLVQLCDIPYKQGFVKHLVAKKLLYIADQCRAVLILKPGCNGNQ